MKTDPAEATYNTLPTLPTGSPLAQPLRDPWRIDGRMLALHRLRIGEPVGLSDAASAALSAFPGCVLERAISDDTLTGCEALGGPSHDPSGTLSALHRCVVVLTHGGPRCADLQRERPRAAGAIVDPITGRTPRALDLADWDVVHRAFLDEAKRMLHLGAYALGVEAARGHLWHSALSPLLGDANGLPRLVRLVRELRALCERVAVSLVVEEVAFGGVHAARGVEMARELANAGAGMIIVRTGGPHAPARLVPPLPRLSDEEGPSLHASRFVRTGLPGHVVVVAAGALHTVGVMERAVSRRLCDAVVVGQG